MGFLFNRAFVTPALLTVGLLVMLGGDVDSGALIDVAGLIYWPVAGWIGRVRGAGRAPSQHTPDVVTVLDQGGQSDGVGGAFGRLHPEMRAWLQEELRARKNTQ